MLEHIFRNINDVRVFDLLVDFPEKGVTEEIVCGFHIGTVDTDEIMNMLDYPEYKRIEVEDSVSHLIREEILGIKKIKEEATTGCKVCKQTDKFKMPRMGDHKFHKAEETKEEYIDNYFMKDNNLTDLLRLAAFEHVTLTLEKETGIRIPTNIMNDITGRIDEGITSNKYTGITSSKDAGITSDKEVNIIDDISHKLSRNGGKPVMKKKLDSLRIGEECYDSSTQTRYECVGKLPNGESVTVARSRNVETI